MGCLQFSVMSTQQFPPPKKQKLCTSTGTLWAPDTVLTAAVDLFYFKIEICVKLLTKGALPLKKPSDLCTCWLEEQLSGWEFHCWLLETDQVSYCFLQHSYTSCIWDCRAMLLKHKAWCARGIRGLRKIPRYSFLGNPSSQNFPSKSRLEKTSNFFFSSCLVFKFCTNSPWAGIPLSFSSKLIQNVATCLISCNWIELLGSWFSIKPFSIIFRKLSVRQKSHQDAHSIKTH